MRYSGSEREISDRELNPSETSLSGTNTTLNDKDILESHWACRDSIDENVDIDDIMNEDEFNDWMIRKSSRCKGRD